MSNDCFDDLIVMCVGFVVCLGVVSFELAFALPLGLFYHDTDVIAGLNVFALVWIILAHVSAISLAWHMCSDENEDALLMRISANLAFAGWSFYGVYLLAHNGSEGHAGSSLAVLASFQVAFSGVFFLVLFFIVLVITDCKILTCQCSCWRALGRLAKAWRTCNKKDCRRVCHEHEADEESPST